MSPQPGLWAPREPGAVWDGGVRALRGDELPGGAGGGSWLPRQCLVSALSTPWHVEKHGEEGAEERPLFCIVLRLLGYFDPWVFSFVSLLK